MRAVFAAVDERHVTPERTINLANTTYRGIFIEFASIFMKTSHRLLITLSFDQRSTPYQASIFRRHSVAPCKVARKPSVGLAAGSYQHDDGKYGVDMKTFVGYVAAVTLAAAAVAAPTSAQADKSGAVAAGVIGGLALGAMIGSAAANNGPYYQYPPAAAYYGPGSPGCYWHRQRVWDGFRWRSTRVYMCY
jgi:hypothetical protein